MNNQVNNISIVCFGEVLWDIFPTYKRIGGAPLNVAYHLKKHRITTRIISKIGDDDLGAAILNQLVDWKIPPSECQIDNSYRTGIVNATFDQYDEAHYSFLENSAWDFIDYKEANRKLIKDSDAFVYGSLVSRNKHSRNTLFQLLENAKYKVFDVNFRHPHYENNVVENLMYKADLIKMNKAELRQMLDHIKQPYTNEEDSVKYIQDYFNCREVIISKGSRGGIYANEYNLYRFPALNITVKDTVGSGDAFLAGFLSEKFTSINILNSIRKGSALGAYITSKAGACPQYSLNEFDDFFYHNIFDETEIHITKL